MLKMFFRHLRVQPKQIGRWLVATALVIDGSTIWAAEPAPSAWPANTPGVVRSLNSGDATQLQFLAPPGSRITSSELEPVVIQPRPLREAAPASELPYGPAELRSTARRKLSDSQASPRVTRRIGDASSAAPLSPPTLATETRSAENSSSTAGGLGPIRIEPAEPEGAHRQRHLLQMLGINSNQERSLESPEAATEAEEAGTAAPAQVAETPTTSAEAPAGAQPLRLVVAPKTPPANHPSADSQSANNQPAESPPAVELASQPQVTPAPGVLGPSQPQPFDRAEQVEAVVNAAADPSGSEPTLQRLDPAMDESFEGSDEFVKRPQFAQQLILPAGPDGAGQLGQMHLEPAAEVPSSHERTEPSMPGAFSSNTVAAQLKPLAAKGSSQPVLAPSAPSRQERSESPALVRPAPALSGHQPVLGGSGANRKSATLVTPSAPEVALPAPVPPVAITETVAITPPIAAAEPPAPEAVAAERVQPTASSSLTLRTMPRTQPTVELTTAPATTPEAAQAPVTSLQLPQSPVAAPSPAENEGQVVMPPRVDGRVQVDVRRSRLVRLDQPVQAAEVVDPQLCEVVQFSRYEVSLIGKRSGTTLVMLYAVGSPTPRVFEVTVGPDQAEMQRRQEQTAKLSRLLVDLFPDSQVELIEEPDQLIVRGRTPSNETAREILNIVRRSRLMPVQDRLEVRP